MGTLYAESSTKITMLKSAIIPGWVQMENGSKTGLIFLTSEIIMWSAKYYYTNESELKEQAAFNYAIKFAGINPEGEYNEDYYHKLSRYNNSSFDSGGYNSYVYLDAQNTSDPEAYIDVYMIQENQAWDWQSKAHRHDYGILRKRVTEFQDYSQAMVGAIIANHLISAIHSVIVQRKSNRVEVGVNLDENFQPRLICQVNF